jgi:hypothetical protein
MLADVLSFGGSLRRQWDRLIAFRALVGQRSWRRFGMETDVSSVQSPSKLEAFTASRQEASPT